MKCEGKNANVKGYIYGLNVFPNESRLLLYSSKSLDYSQVFNLELLDVKVNRNDSSSFFSKLKSAKPQLTDATWKEVIIKGEIYGWDMAGNGWCKKAFAFKGHDINILN